MNIKAPLDIAEFEKLLLEHYSDLDVQLVKKQLIDAMVASLKFDANTIDFSIKAVLEENTGYHYVLENITMLYPLQHNESDNPLYITLRFPNYDAKSIAYCGDTTVDADRLFTEIHTYITTYFISSMSEI